MTSVSAHTVDTRVHSSHQENSKITALLADKLVATLQGTNNIFTKYSKKTTNE